MNKEQLQVKELPSEVSLLSGLMLEDIRENVHSISHNLAKSSKAKMSEIQLEMYALSLASAAYGYICEVTEDDSIDPQGLTAIITNKIKQAAIDITAQELGLIK